MLLITVLLNYGTLAKLILAKLASKNRMPGFMRPGLILTSALGFLILQFFESNRYKKI